MGRDGINAREGVESEGKHEMEVLEVSMEYSQESQWLGFDLERKRRERKNTLKSHNLFVSAVD